MEGVKGLLVRLALAVVAGSLSSVLAGLVFWVGHPIVYGSFSWAEFASYVQVGLIYGVYGIPIAFVVLVAYGVPAFLVLRRLGLANFATAAVLAVLPWLVLRYLVGEDSRGLWEFETYSLVVAFVFYSVLRPLATRTNHAAL